MLPSEDVIACIEEINVLHQFCILCAENVCPSARPMVIKSVQPRVVKMSLVEPLRRCTLMFMLKCSNPASLCVQGSTGLSI